LYTTVLGVVKTVLVIEDVTETLTPPPKLPALLLEEFRDWTGNDGEVLVSGVYGEFSKGVLTVIDSEGEDRFVTPRELSKEDQSWVRYRLREDAKKAKSQKHKAQSPGITPPNFSQLWLFSSGGC
jgi:hypothetical protein